MQVMDVPSKIRSYTVHFDDSWHTLDALTQNGDYLCVIDENVWKLYKDQIPFLTALPAANRLIFPVNEQQKTLAGVEAIYDSLINRVAKKNISLLAIGGGILQDAAGFAASTLYRGIRWVYIPTTLLGQSDSCIGGKTSINYKQYKNLLGTFYPPYEVHIFPEFLNSLAKIDYYSGLGEVVKLHLIDGAAKTAWYQAHQKNIWERHPRDVMQSIKNSLAIKIAYITEDEFDQGKRNMLNFGHCYGHALESVSHFNIPHGQAVLVGILFAGIVARNRGLQGTEFERSVATLVQAHIVSLLKSEYFSSVSLLEAVRKDKKRTGANLSVILMSDQHVMQRFSDLTDEEFLKAHEELKKRLLDHSHIPR